VHRKRAELMQLAELFQGEIVDVGVEHVTIMLTAWPKRIDALIELARP
jgi:acetolactate synthase small subunit